MATIFYDVLRTRIEAIVSGGRGADGSLGTLAQQRSIPADRFRKALENVDLRDPAYPSAQMDRAYRLDLLSVTDTPLANNAYSDTWLRDVSLQVIVGYVHGDGNVAWPKLLTNETAATAVRYSADRAFSDAERIRRALDCQELFSGTVSAVGLVTCTRSGASVLEQLPDGRLLAATIYSVTIQLDATQNYDP